MKRNALRALAVALALGGAGLIGLRSSARGLQEQPFPHEQHERLFPVCTGCHQGIPERRPGRVLPRPGDLRRMP